MRQLELIPLSTEGNTTPLTGRTLTVGYGESARGCVVAASVLERRLLTSLHVFRSTNDLYKTRIGKPRLTRHNPFRNESELGCLDDQGLVREGTVVAVGDVLASVVIADCRSRINGRPMPEKGMQWIRDDSWGASSDLAGSVVTSARRLQREVIGSDAPPGLLERIEIVFAPNTRYKSATFCPFAINRGLSVLSRTNRRETAKAMRPIYSCPAMPRFHWKYRRAIS